MTYDDETSSTTSTSTTSTSSLEQIVVTAPRISINQDMFQNIQWSDVVPLTLLGGVGGVFNGIPGILLGAAVGTATAIETQDDTSLVDLFQLENDMIFIPTLPGAYIPML
ncbi:MAG: hypothetical protein ACNA7W_04330 [Pseudomonadales bacterium]